MLCGYGQYYATINMIFAPLAAPPLSLDNVLRAVTGVNWRTLGQRLFFYDLDAIREQHGSDEDRLKRVVENFLSSLHPSWRQVIWALYMSNAIHLAEHIRSYAEPLEGVLEHV